MKKVTEAEVRGRLVGRPLTLLHYAGSILSKSLFKCHVCEHEWEASADNVTRGKGCPQCKLANSLLTKENAEKRANLLGFTLVEYTKASAKVTVQCVNPECRHRVSVRNLQHVERLQGCRKCWERARGLLDEQVYPALKARGITLLRRAKNTSDLSRFRCDVDGHEWETNLGDVLRGQGCRKCAGRMTLTAEDVRSRLVGRHIHLLAYGGTGQSPESLFQCEVDRHTWKTTANSVLAGTGCAKCAGIVPYTEFELRERLAAQDVELLFFDGYTGRNSRFRCTRDGMEWVCAIRDTLQNADFCPRCGNREEYSKEKVLSGIQGRPLQLLDFQPKSQGRSLFRCLDDACGYEWRAANTNVVGANTGCPKCAGTMPLTEEEVRGRLVGRPSVTLVRYSGSAGSKSVWHCEDCGEDWEAKAEAVVGKAASGCPNCAVGGFKPSKPAHFYCYEISKAGQKYIGFGITGVLWRRSGQHEDSFAEAGATGKLLWTVYHEVGSRVREVEDEIKRTFPITSSGVDGFIHEAMLYEDGLADRLYSYVMEKLDLNCNKHPEEFYQQELTEA